MHLGVKAEDKFKTSKEKSNLNVLQDAFEGKKNKEFRYNNFSQGAAHPTRGQPNKNICN